MSENVATTRYRQARDELLALRGKHEEAVASFTWPDLGERFNWAHDWFDVVARGNDAKALVMASEDAREGPRAFIEKRVPLYTGR